jgi:hypothetical protein
LWAVNILRITIYSYTIKYLMLEIREASKREGPSSVRSEEVFVYPKTEFTKRYGGGCRTTDDASHLLIYVRYLYYLADPSDLAVYGSRVVGSNPAGDTDVSLF